MSNNFSSPSNQQALAKVTFRFQVWFISSLAILPTFVIAILSALQPNEVVVECCFLPFVLVIATSGIFGLLFLYTVWQQIPLDIARTTPGKAIGFLFIPFFSIYWQFVAIYGLGKDLNQALEQAGLRPQVNETVGLVSCVACIASCIPAIGTLITIAGLIAGLIYMFSLKNGVVKLLTIQQPLDNNLVTPHFNNSVDH
jgi:hypothetical protein